ncbi:UNVERIFIED_ORG: hypothetical protein J2Y81_007941 [Paraburkholderia sediminicola]|nr:hypothetical protein [Paraburkholderia sediminicola]
MLGGPLSGCRSQLVDKDLLLEATDTVMQVFHRHEPVATHSRVAQADDRHTCSNAFVCYVLSHNSALYMLAFATYSAALASMPLISSSVSCLTTFPGDDRARNSGRGHSYKRGDLFQTRHKKILGMLCPELTITTSVIKSTKPAELTLDSLMRPYHQVTDYFQPSSRSVARTSRCSSCSMS